MNSPPALRTVFSLLVLYTLTVGAATPSSYSRMKLFDLAARADVIVSGEITSVEKGTFVFAVDDVVLGEAVAETLKVACFKNWTCHGRWTGYMPGQRLLLFLRSAKDKPQLYRILGAGDEGEMPFVSGHVVMDDAHDSWVQGFEVQTHGVTGGEITGTKLPYTELKEAVLGFHRAYEWTRDKQALHFLPRGKFSSAEEFSKTSKIALHMHSSLLSSRYWKGSLPDHDVLLALSEVNSAGISETTSPGPFLPVPGRTRRLARNEFSWHGYSSLAMIGDVDGDGIGDLAAGYSRSGFGQNRQGTLWILFLDEAGDVRGRTEVGEGCDGFPIKLNEFAALGKAVAPLGDLDRDGIPDLIVGAPGWHGTSKRGGGAWVLFLKRTGQVKTAVELGATEALAAAGVSAGFGLGEAISALGDLDGDGTLEVAISQYPMLSYDERTGRSVLLVSLDAQANVHRVRRLHASDDGFGSKYAWFGSAIAAVGDLDGDGTIDLAISDDGSSDGGNTRGAVWIVFLTPDLEIKGKQKISDWSGGFEGLLRNRAYFGHALASPGDVDGDGVPDLVVASSGRLWTLFLERSGHVRRHVEVAFGDSGGPTAITAGPRTSAQKSLLVSTQARRGGPPLWWLELNSKGELHGR